MLYDSIRLPIYAILVTILIFNLTQRRYLEHGEEKRFASLRAAGLVLLLALEYFLIDRFSLNTWLAIPAVLSVLYLAYRMRNRLLIFKLHCENCGRPLPVTRTLYYDDNHCEACAESHETLRRSGEQSSQYPNGIPDSVDKIDWESWQPDERAVLCFVRRGDELLLIEKKTGLGAGKVNAPGGRIEPDESALDAAIRECVEEIGVTPSDIEKRVDLKFVFTNGYSLEASAFFAASFSGVPISTPEADPFWCKISELPYERMWDDDSEWLPGALEGKKVDARFIFDGERMSSKRVIVLDG